MPFDEDIATLCVDAGIGAIGTVVFISTKGEVPSGPGPYVSIVATWGLEPDRTHNQISPPAYKRPRVQITARALDKLAADAMVDAARQAVCRRNVTVNGNYYREIDVMQEPFDLPLDNNARFRTAFNVQVK